jgi:hypothetical protein
MPEDFDIFAGRIDVACERNLEIQGVKYARMLGCGVIAFEGAKNTVPIHPAVDRIYTTAAAHKLTGFEKRSGSLRSHRAA